MLLRVCMYVPLYRRGGRGLLYDIVRRGAIVGRHEFLRTGPAAELGIRARKEQKNHVTGTKSNIHGSLRW